VKGPDDVRGAAEFRALEAEAAARRLRLSGNFDELVRRMTFENLVREAKDGVLKEVDRVTDNVLTTLEDLGRDTVAWGRDNRSLLAGGLLTGLVAAGAIWFLTRRRMVPLYAAYDMEDPDMMNDSEASGEALGAKMGDKAGKAWDKVRSEAQQVGDRAGEAYYSARSRAADLADEARERAAHAADAARERALEAADAAREAAERAREAAGDAGRWARRQPQENPATVVLVALAAGALIGALLPAAGRHRS
jgi:ElaB/YqjD/DUF883 family membrane-anchored ribosome-binding protein